MSPLTGTHSPLPPECVQEVTSPFHPYGLVLRLCCLRSRSLRRSVKMGYQSRQRSSMNLELFSASFLLSSLIMVLQFLMAFFIVPVDLFRLNVRSSRVRQMQQLSFGLLQSHTTESSLMLFETPVFILFTCTLHGLQSIDRNILWSSTAT